MGVNKKDGKKGWNWSGLKKNIEIQQTKNCTEHLWYQVGYARKFLNCCVVYLETKEQDLRWNASIWTCVQQHLIEIKEGREDVPIIIVGDFNAHILELDGREDITVDF